MWSTSLTKQEVKWVMEIISIPEFQWDFNTHVPVTLRTCAGVSAPGLGNVWMNDIRGIERKHLTPQ